MIKELFEKLKTTNNPEEYNSLSAQMLDLLSDVKTAEQLKEVYAKDGLELSDQEAERMFEELSHVRKMKRNPLDTAELSLVSGGGEAYDQHGPDGWLPEERGVYRYKNKVYHRGGKFRIRELDHCAKTEDGWCWWNDACEVAFYYYDRLAGDGRTDIDPDRMSDDFINGVITGGEDF